MTNKEHISKLKKERQELIDNPITNPLFGNMIHLWEKKISNYTQAIKALEKLEEEGK